MAEEGLSAGRMCMVAMRCGQGQERQGGPKEALWVSLGWPHIVDTVQKLPIERHFILSDGHLRIIDTEIVLTSIILSLLYLEIKCC